MANNCTSCEQIEAGERCTHYSWPCDHCGYFNSPFNFGCSRCGRFDPYAKEEGCPHISSMNLADFYFLLRLTYEPCEAEGSPWYYAVKMHRKGL